MWPDALRIIKDYILHKVYSHRMGVVPPGVCRACTPETRHLTPAREDCEQLSPCGRGQINHTIIHVNHHSL